MQKVFRVTVDISKKIPAPAFEVNTNDLKSVKLEITITNGQSLLDLTDVTPRINIRKPDNEVIFQDCEIVDAKAGKVQIVLENQAYLVPGTHTAEIACYKGNEITAITGTFSYKSVKGIMNDEAVESKSEFTAIDRKIEAARKLLEDIGENGVGVDEQARQKIEEVTTQLADEAKKTTENKRANNYYWLPESQRPARKDHENSWIDAFNKDANYYINDFFEPLRLANPKYITRESMGKDSSGEFDVWRYFFTPKNYTKTILIVSGTHGEEITPVISMIRFLHYLTNEYDKYPQLADIRENIRIIYIPFVNPWAVKLPRKRHNANGVDINRNYDYKWAEFNALKTRQPYVDSDYPGTAPFSEVETRYVRDTLEAFPSISAYLDLHNTGAPNRHFYVDIPEGIYPYENIYSQLADYFSKGISNPVTLFTKTANPTAANYIYKKYGIPASIPEWCDGNFGAVYSGADITKAIEWFSNVIIEHCRRVEFEPFLIEGHYNSGVDSVSLAVGTTLTEIEAFRLPVKIPCDGLLEVELIGTFTSSEPTSQVAFSARIDQTGSDWTTSTSKNEVIANGDRLVMPCMANKRVVASEGGKGLAIIRTFARTAAGSTLLVRYRMKVKFTPAMSMNRYKVLSATGRIGMGAEVFKQDYPL